jgi:V/A-type H+-transporting ATPase subunit I
MAVASMKKVFLVAHRDDRDAVTEVLQRLGVLQVEDILSVSELEKDSDFVWRDEPGAKASEIDARLAELRFCLDFVQRLAPEKVTFLQQFTGTKVFLKEEEFRHYLQKTEEVAKTEKALRAADNELNRIRNEETPMYNSLAAIEPYLNLDVPLEELAAGPDVAIEVGVLPLSGLDSFTEELGEASPGSYIEELGRGREEVYVFILSAQMDQEEVQAILRQHSFSRASFPDVHGTPMEVKAQIEKELEALAARREEVITQAKEHVDKRVLLKAAYDELSLKRAQLDLALQFGRTDETFALTGWIEEKYFPRLKKTIQEISPSAYLCAEDPQEGDNPPVTLENTGAVWPFEVITELFGLPEPGGIDPTPYLAPFYFLFLGMMYGDAAYGLILASLCWYAMKKIRMAGMAEKLFKLLILGGVSSMLFGIVTGSYFGSLPIPPIWFSPIDDPLKMLVVSMAVGVIHIYTGIIINMVHRIKSGQVLDAIYDQGFWLVFLTGLLLMIPGTFGQAAKIIAIIGAGGLILTQGRDNKNIIKRLLSGIMSLYDISGYLSDVLSYSRLLALGLGTTVIGMVINNMVSMAAEGGAVGIVLGAIIFVGGHGFNLLINVIGAYVHASRLQYVEFFTKFYESGGRSFAPFRITTRYIDLELEEREA